VRDADALIIRTRTKCDAKLLKGTDVKFIATATIGYDHIDARYCRKHGIEWTNAPGCNSGSVQQYMASALLFLASKYNFPLKDRALGIVGVGNVGSKVWKLAETFGMKVLLNDPPRAREEGEEGFVSLKEVVEQSDIITFHVPLYHKGKDKTYHLVDAKMLTHLKQDAFLINSSRGAVVNNKELKHAILEGDIAGAILDVWENEPNIDPELHQMVDAGTPHIAGYSRDGKANGTAMSVQAVSKFFQLGLDEWYPANVEKPKKTHIEVDCWEKGFERILYEAISQTYKIEEDHKKLLSNIDNFEFYRGNYPVRREFSSYTIRLKNDDGYFAGIFKSLGFKVE
jgi:erythronate-4-phosphate dehydrogenase